MSQLVNVPDVAERRAFLRTCAQHVADDGIVVIERHEPDWEPVADRPSERGGVTFVLEDVRREGQTVAATVRYAADGKTWRHPFVARLLNDDDLDVDLRAVGLQLTRVIDERQTWVEAWLYSDA